MSVLNDAKLLIESLDKIKENLNLTKINPSGSIFNSLEIRKGSIHTETSANKPIITSKSKKYYFRISFLKNSIQFLDLKSILNLSLVNKEFGYFIKSVYFYKFTKCVKNSKTQNKKTNSNNFSNKKVTPSKTNSSNDQTGGVSNLFGLGNYVVGALGSVLGIKQYSDSKERKIDPIVLEEKYKIYEKILNTKLKNSKMSQEMRELRENIDTIVSEKIAKKSYSPIKKDHFNYHNFMIDEELQKIKRDKLESESDSLKIEVESLIKEVNYHYDYSMNGLKSKSRIKIVKILKSRRF